MKDLTVTLEDRPGTLADLGEALGKAGINIEGLCAVGSEGRAIVHLLVDDAAATRGALEGAGIKVEGEADPMISELASDQVDRPGAIGQMARAMADAGVNIQVAYLATKNRAVVVTSDNAKARQALGM
ncbi:MAG TPA: ACT domain-containing protein [Actinomycetota bacterium]|nr:ACT domain-containing protein [Actinomycetota bacterium]